LSIVFSAEDFEYVDSDSALSEMVECCLKQQLVALDTEFIRRDTFYPLPALLQLYDGKTIFLVDPLQIDDFSPLRKLFLAPDTVKVMHSCSEDMAVFSRLLGCFPRPLVDTQIAASLVGLPYSMSYQRLVSELTGLELQKGETRSDWLQRPLTTSQCHYASDDVLYLLDVYSHLNTRLAELGRQSWLQEECDALLQLCENPLPSEEYYFRIKNAWRLDVMSLNALRALCAWREQKASEHDVPRGRVASDAVLLEVAQRRPNNKRDLSKLRSIYSTNVRCYGDDLLAVLSDALGDDSASFPEPMAEKNRVDIKATLKLMKRRVLEVAEGLNIPVEILARKQDLETYLFAASKSETSIGAGWRREFLAEDLDRVIEKHYRH